MFSVTDLTKTGLSGRTSIIVNLKANVKERFQTYGGYCEDLTICRQEKKHS